MVMYNPGSIGLVLLLGATNGFSPFALPLAAILGFELFPASWWTWVFNNYTQWHLITFALPAVAIITYWVNGLLMLAVEWWMQPEVLKPFKIQPGKRFDQQVLPKVFANILVGQFGVIVPYALACAYLVETSVPIGLRMEAELPSGRRVLLEVLGMLLFNEVTFFYGHWALHQKIWGVNLYTRFHKMHHEFTAPIALTASYCHPLEMLVCNAFPLTFGAGVLHCHGYTILLWVCFAVMGTQYHHGGYRWPWCPFFEHQPNFHDFHHESFSSNFGNIGWLDALHGTDKAFHEAVKKRGSLRSHPLSLSIVGSLGLALVASFVL